MKDSCCPDQVTDLGRDAVTGYNANPDGTFTPVPAVMCTIPATGGLWVPAADMVWLGTSWSGLLPCRTGPRGGHPPDRALDAFGGLVNPVAVAVNILAFVIWLLGLIAVVRLWQATFTACFKAAR